MALDRGEISRVFNHFYRPALAAVIASSAGTPRHWVPYTISMLLIAASRRGLFHCLE
jgi:hypothetical protein